MAITIGGYLGYHASTDFEEFLNAAKQLSASDIYRVIKDAELLSGPVPTTFPANLCQHVEWWRCYYHWTWTVEDILQISILTRLVRSGPTAFATGPVLMA